VGMVSGGGGTTLEAEGEEALASEGWVKTRRHDNYTRGKKGLHLLGALDLPATLEAGRPLLLLLLVPLGEITPRWWWWRQDRWWWWRRRRIRWWRWRWRWRRTDSPLCTLSLGAGLLGPASYPLTLLGRVCNKGRVHDKRPVGATQPASPLFLRPLGATRGGGATCSPFDLVQGARGRGGSSGARTSGLGASNRHVGDLDPVVGSRLPVWRTATPLSSRVGSEARIVVFNPGSSQSVGMPWGRIRDSGMKDSPVIPFTRTSSSSQDKLVPDPRCIRPMSFEPVNQQHKRSLLCSGVIRRFKKSSTTCIDVRPLVAKVLILSNTGRNSGANDGLALHCFRSSFGPSLGSARRSLASVLAITQSVRQFSHLTPPREEM
jgi:hypothetical protein